MFIDLSREEMAYAKRYPAHTALCIRDGWEFCRPDHAAGESFRAIATPHGRLNCFYERKCLLPTLATPCLQIVVGHAVHFAFVNLLEICVVL